MLRSRRPWSAHVTGGCSTGRGSSGAQAQYPSERSSHQSSGAAKCWDRGAPSSLLILRRPRRRGRRASDGGDGWSITVNCLTPLVDRCTGNLVFSPCTQSMRSKASWSTLITGCSAATAWTATEGRYDQVQQQFFLWNSISVH